MFQKFYPSEDIRSTYDIDFERYYKEGYRGVIFDVDNTLVPHNAPADERARSYLRDLMRLECSIALQVTTRNRESKLFVKRFMENIMYTKRISHQ